MKGVRVLQDRRFLKVQNANPGIKIQLNTAPQTFLQSPHENIKRALNIKTNKQTNKQI